jgi:hypothetical protein
MEAMRLPPRRNRPFCMLSGTLALPVSSAQPGAALGDPGDRLDLHDRVIARSQTVCAGARGHGV